MQQGAWKCNQIDAAAEYADQPEREPLLVRESVADLARERTRIKDCV